MINSTVCADTKQTVFSSRTPINTLWLSLTKHNVGIALHPFLTSLLQLLCFRFIGGCLLNNGRLWVLVMVDHGHFSGYVIDDFGVGFAVVICGSRLVIVDCGSQRGNEQLWL